MHPQIYSRISFLIKAHTNKQDEHSLGNDLADKLATDALKFENGNDGILKYFQ